MPEGQDSLVGGLHSRRDVIRYGAAGGATLVQNEGGYINWGTNDLVDCLSTKVKGLTPSMYLNASGFNFRKAWIAR
jgi:hypothetical protein